MYAYLSQWESHHILCALAGFLLSVCQFLLLCLPSDQGSVVVTLLLPSVLSVSHWRLIQLLLLPSISCGHISALKITFQEFGDKLVEAL